MNIYLTLIDAVREYLHEHNIIDILLYPAPHHHYPRYHLTILAGVAEESVKIKINVEKTGYKIMTQRYNNPWNEIMIIPYEDPKVFETIANYITTMKMKDRLSWFDS